jgi:hypothetical protein
MSSPFIKALHLTYHRDGLVNKSRQTPMRWIRDVVVPKESLRGGKENCQAIEQCIADILEEIYPLSQAWPSSR